MTIPDSIPFASVRPLELRSEYFGIEELAESISDNGLIQPLVLAPGREPDTWDICGGTRRWHALKLLAPEFLYHAVTSEPGRYGFVLKGEDESTPLNNLLTVIAENLDRHNLPWQDELRQIVKAWRLAKEEAGSRAEKLLMRDFGATLGVGYAKLQAAAFIYDDVVANPDRYAQCNGIRGAYNFLLRENEKAVAQLAADRAQAGPSLGGSSKVTLTQAPADRNDFVPLERAPAVQLPFSLYNVASTTWMEGVPASSVDHIVTDPDYAVATETLESSVGGAAEGVVQENITQSLSDLEAFITQSFRVLKPSGFCVFWYDLDHHEKLQRLAKAVGFRVQRWPLIWHKVDYHSNASPQSNFCKNLEYAMVLRMPGATLTGPQMTSVFQTTGAGAVKRFGHPFAKPTTLWTWILKAIAVPGQTILDPFAGSGSCPTSCIPLGLTPIACEVQTQFFNSLVLNVQHEYKLKFGPDVSFTR